MTTASKTWRHTANSFAGEPIEIGSTVTRIDNYKGPRRGKVLVIDRDRGYCYVLVRWPNLDDEWMHPGMLVPVVDE